MNSLEHLFIILESDGYNIENTALNQWNANKENINITIEQDK